MAALDGPPGALRASAPVAYLGKTEETEHFQFFHQDQVIGREARFCDCACDQDLRGGRAHAVRYRDCLTITLGKAWAKLDKRFKLLTQPLLLYLVLDWLSADLSLER